MSLCGSVCVALSVITIRPSENFGSGILLSVILVKLADNEAVRLIGLLLLAKTAPAALSLALHRSPFLAGGDSVPVAFQDLLGNPANHGCFVLFTVELCDKLLLERFDV